MSKKIRQRRILAIQERGSWGCGGSARSPGKLQCEHEHSKTRVMNRHRTSHRATRVEMAWHPPRSTLTPPHGYFFSSQLGSSAMGRVFPRRWTAAAARGRVGLSLGLRGGSVPSRLARRAIRRRSPFPRAFPVPSPLPPAPRGCLTSLLRFRTGAMPPAGPHSPAGPAVPGPLRALPTPQHEPKPRAGAAAPLPPQPRPGRGPRSKLGLKSFDWVFFPPVLARDERCGQGADPEPGLSEACGAVSKEVKPEPRAPALWLSWARCCAPSPAGCLNPKPLGMYACKSLSLSGLCSPRLFYNLRNILVFLLCPPCCRWVERITGVNDDHCRISRPCSIPTMTKQPPFSNCSTIFRLSFPYVPKEDLELCRNCDSWSSGCVKFYKGNSF